MIDRGSRINNRHMPEFMAMNLARDAVPNGYYHELVNEPSVNITDGLARRGIVPPPGWDEYYTDVDRRRRERQALKLAN